jgi:hypothetical protein
MIPGAGVIFTDNDTNQVEIDDVYGQVQDIEIISSGGDATKVDKAGSGFFYFVGCILKTTAANSSAGKAASGGAATSLAFANCLAMGSVRGFETANAGTKVYNCTAVGNGTGLSGLMDATNCIAQDNTTNYSGASLTTCVVDNSVTFVGGGDYHLAAGDTAARGNGTDLSAFFTDDGDGDTRSAWDIGFDEVVNTPPASPTTPSPTDASTIASTTSVTLSCVVYDADGDNLTVTFKDGSDDSTIDTDTVAGGSGTASVTWSGLTPGSTYSWYVTVSDGTDTTTGSMWTFTVAAAGSKIFNFCMDFGLSL